MTTELSLSEAREALFEAFADRTSNIDEATETALGVGKQFLDLDTGFRTRIADGIQYVEQTVGTVESVHVDMECPLDEAYCKRTIERDSPLSVHHVGTGTAVTEAAIDRFELGAYIGCKVTVDGDLHGTVCFAGEERRTPEFTEAEELFVELLAGLVGQGLERRQYEQSLEERNARLESERRRFKRIADTSADVIYQLDDQGRFTYLSPAADRIMGHDPSSMIGSHFAEYVSEESFVDAVNAFEQSLDGTPTTGLSIELVDVDGEEVPFEVNSMPIDNERSDSVIQGIARDISERQQREEQLRLLNRAIDAANVGIGIADVTGAAPVFTYVNDALVELTDWPREELIGEHMDIFFGAETDVDATNRISEAVDQGNAETVKAICYRDGDLPFWCRITVAPVENNSGEITHYIGFHEDITERMRTTKLLGVIDRVLRHNVRNKLGVVDGFAELLREQTGPEPVDRILSATEDVLNITSGTRMMREVASNPHDPKRYDVTELTTTTGSSVQKASPDAEITVTVETDVDVAIGQEIERALTELVENAVTHTDNPPAVVTINAQRDDDKVEIEIRDNGPGIDPYEAETIAFGEETAVQHGQGIGLWFVNWIVTKYGGSFQIAPLETGTETGTVATIRLPVLEPQAAIADIDTRPTVLSW